MDEYMKRISDSVAANNAWSAQAASDAMSFSERMSSTAHQREVEDLKAAGLNPVLSTSHSGASAPTGAVANGDQSGTAALAGIIGSLVSSQTAMANAMTQASSAQAVAQVAAWSAGNVAQINTSSQQTMQQREFEYKENHPNNLTNAVASILNNISQGAGLANTAQGIRSGVAKVGSWLKGVFK